jgi:hypothetical protein
LPNNKNIVQAANQVPSLTDKKVYVVPTQSIPQGIAAMLAFNFEQGLEQNGAGMEEAARQVNTVEVTRAVRSTKIGRLDVKKGQAIGIVDGDLLVAGDSVPNVLKETLTKVDMSSAEMVTLYYGADTSHEEADGVVKVLSAAYPRVQFEIVKGGQPYYNYIVSVE